jgi:hypothetical protein
VREHGVSKDGHMHCGLGPSFETALRGSSGRGPLARFTGSAV